MRVMVMVKATEESEAGVMPSTELLEAMGRYNEELVKAGIMLAGEGLQPSAKGARVAFDGPQRTVIDGPFAQTKELVAGYWLWEVKDLAEAVEWVKRCPNPMPGPSEIEIRPIFEAEDFGAEFTPELREQEDRLPHQVGTQDVLATEPRAGTPAPALPPLHVSVVRSDPRRRRQLSEHRLNRGGQRGCICRPRCPRRGWRRSGNHPGTRRSMSRIGTGRDLTPGHRLTGPRW